ncbi:MAG: hypothetical protein FWH24_03500, partial [Oscillospiraceae bacterium]|nr:hypothetical protein [Oscillospiraceae bacterium]
GFKSVLRNEFNLYAISFMFFLFAAIYTITAYILKYNIVLFNSIGTFAILSLLVYNIFDIIFEITGFQAVSSKKLKYALRFDNGAPKEREVFRDVIPQDTAVGRITKTAFVSNFFARTGRYKNHREASKYIYFSLSAVIVISVVMIILNREIPSIMTAALFLFLGSVPLCSFISAAYPLHRAQKKSQISGAAFIGANSIEENSEIAILSVFDKDIFPPANVKMPGVRVYGKNRLDNVMLHLCSLFAKLNLPAAEEFKSSVDWDAEKEAEADIKINDVSEIGVCYETHGLVLFAGRAKYIENLGFSAPVDIDYDEQFLKSSGSIMYLASDSEVIAKIYLKYELTENFHDILKNVKKMNSCMCIKTFDPNIDDALLRRLSNIKKFPIKVLKLKNWNDIYKIEESTETGVVSKDSLKAAIDALLIAGRANRTVKSNALVQSIAFVINLLLTAGLIFFGTAFLTSAVIILPVQIFWGGVIIFLSVLSP